jgi:alanine-synthesizing transaminase
MTSSSITHQHSTRLADVCYDIRGEALQLAKQLEEEGHRILKLNIGNPAAFGFEAPDEIVRDMVHNLADAQGYSDSKGLFAARKAVMQHYQAIVPGVDVEDIFMGNGASELIGMAVQALLEDGDEVLIPSPDYPLWTASVRLCGGSPVHYVCDEQNGWFPDLEDIASKITDRTRAIVIINPNNPTGAVYPRELLEGVVAVARDNGLVIFADEIYDKILYDDAEHTVLASIATDVLCVTFNGLSKAYRAAGYRSGWMMFSGAKGAAKNYIEGIEILTAMRLCANVPGQFAVQTALGGYQTINDLVLPGGRLRDQRDVAYELVNAIPSVSCVKPMGALYLFGRIDPKQCPIDDDERFIRDLLREQKMLLVEGTAFNLPRTGYFRIVTLPHVEQLEDAAHRLEAFLAGYSQ